MDNDGNRIHIDEIIVVEGRDDTAAVLRGVDALTIETHGYGIREETWSTLEKAYETRGLIIFTDPDPAGERIRKRLKDRFPKAKEAFLERSEAAKNGDIGIENAEPEVIRKAILNAHAVEVSGEEGGEEGTDDRITADDMYMWKLDGCPGASERRKAIGREIGIGYAGAKTFLKRLNGFGIDKRKIETLLEDLE